jgi:hypothetical protein
LNGVRQETPGLTEIGIQDNSIELGSDSVQAALLANHLQQRLGAVVLPVVIFGAPTVALLDP